MTCERTVDVGAYVLGALGPADRSTLEQHLPTCDVCSGELAELAVLPGLLGRLSPLEAERSADAPPARLLDGLLARAGRRRRRRVRLAAAAAAVVVAAGIGTGVAASTAGGSSGRQVAATAGPVSAQATLRSAASGVAVDLRLRGVPAGTQCRLVVVATNGQQIGAGTWYAGYAGDASVTETAATQLDRIAALRVETIGGTLLVDIPVAGASARPST